MAFHTTKWWHLGASNLSRHQGPSVQSLSRVLLFVTAWTAAHKASLSVTNSRSLLKLMSIESVMPSNHFILCHPLLLLPSLFPSIRVFSNESVFRIRWPKYWTCLGQTLDKYWTNKYWLRYQPRSLGGLLKQQDSQQPKGGNHPDVPALPWSPGTGGEAATCCGWCLTAREVARITVMEAEGTCRAEKHLLLKLFPQPR